MSKMMKKLNNKRGFTLIELIVVMAIIGILVMLAMPKFMGYTEKAKLTNIQNDIKVAENKVEEILVKENKEFNEWDDVDKSKLEEAKDEQKLYGRGGLVTVDNPREKDIEAGEYRIINSDFVKTEVKSKLKGTFYANSDGKVYYEDIKARKGSDEAEKGTYGPNGEFIPEGYTLAKDSDFEYVVYSSAPNAYEDGQKGYYKYTGTDEYVVIPHTINGNEIKDYYRMFYQNTTVKGVASDNPNVTDTSGMFRESQAAELDLSKFDTSNVTNMSFMFSASQATTLDLSSFDTSNVTDMNYMFNNSQATTLDLSSFDTSNVTDMSSMFYNSQATTGYARTQADADRFNASSNKPSGLTFVVKNQ